MGKCQFSYCSSGQKVYLSFGTLVVLILIPVMAIADSLVRICDKKRSVVFFEGEEGEQVASYSKSYGSDSGGVGYSVTTFEFDGKNNLKSSITRYYESKEVVTAEICEGDFTIWLCGDDSIPSTVQDAYEHLSSVAEDQSFPSPIITGPGLESPSTTVVRDGRGCIKTFGEVRPDSEIEGYKTTDPCPAKEIVDVDDLIEQIQAQCEDITERYNSDSATTVSDGDCVTTGTCDDVTSMPADTAEGHGTAGTDASAGEVSDSSETSDSAIVPDYGDATVDSNDMPEIESAALDTGIEEEVPASYPPIEEPIVDGTVDEADAVIIDETGAPDATTYLSEDEFGYVYDYPTAEHVDPDGAVIAYGG